jgi:hypothetical protein
MKMTPTPYWKVAGAGSNAFAAICKAEHPTGDVSGWMFWTVAVLAANLFVMSLFEKLPIIGVAVCRAMQRDATKKTSD